MKCKAKRALAAAALVVSASAAASDTVSYTYDALGRLNDVAVSGGPNDGSAGATRYDPAGNRTTYSVSGTGPAGLAAASQSASSGEMMEGFDETGAPTAIPPAAVEAPPPGGIPDEAAPVVESGAVEGAAGDPGDAR